MKAGFPSAVVLPVVLSLSPGNLRRCCVTHSRIAKGTSHYCWSNLLSVQPDCLFTLRIFRRHRIAGDIVSAVRHASNHSLRNRPAPARFTREEYALTSGRFCPTRCEMEGHFSIPPTSPSEWHLWRPQPFPICSILAGLHSPCALMLKVSCCVRSVLKSEMRIERCQRNYFCQITLCNS